MNMKTKIIWRFVINGGYIDGCIESIDWLLQEMIRFNLRFIKQNFGNISIGHIYANELKTCNKVRFNG